MTTRRLPFAVLCLAGILAVITMSGVASARTVSLLDTDFGDCTEPVEEMGGVATDRTSGMLPFGWREQSNWARVWVTYKPLQEEGHKFLRVQVTKVENGCAQFYAPLPAVDQPMKMRASLSARGGNTAQLDMGIRIAGTPYTYLWQVAPKLSSQWADLTYEFEVQPYAGEVGLFLRVNGVGSVDISRLRLEWVDAPEAARRVAIETNFGDAVRPVAEAGNNTGRATGVLPSDWREDSGWAQVWVNYERLEEEGRPYLRVSTSRVDAGRCQLAHDLEDIRDETFFRLSFTVRSAANGSVEFQIRDAGPPYKTLWAVRPKVDGTWQTFTYDFHLARYEPKVAFFIGLEGVNTLDLSKLKLERLSRADYIAELQEKYGGGAPRNLLRITRFPLGLQSGWALDRDNSDGDDVVISPDLGCIGPSGAPSLYVKTAEPTRLYSAPFAIPLAFRPHVASLYALGSGTLRISVAAENRAIAEKTFNLAGTGEWERVQVRFAPVLMCPSYVLQLAFSADIHLDALQVEAAATATPYASQGDAEVSLGIPDSDASVARVQFTDEPARVIWCVTGKAAGATLKGRVVNVYGQQQPLPPVTLKEGFVQQGEWEYPLFAAQPLGPHRVEAWVEDEAGRQISPPNEIVINRLRRPRYWGQDAPNSPFGVHTNSTTRHNVMAKAVGANWTRLHDAGLQYIGWYHLEPEPGKWTFHDKEILRYRRDHILILGELGTAPFWASYFPGDRQDGYFDRFYQPRRMEDYANYVQTVGKRYKGVISAWDVWNEPWIWSWWAVAHDPTKPGRDGYITSEHPQADFARLMKTAYENAKACDPTVTVLGFNTTTGGGGGRNFGGSEWTRGVLDAGGLAHCDAICYHNYISGSSCYPDDVVERGFQTATGPIQEKLGALPKPVWMTEGSAGRETMGPGFYNHTLPFPNTEDPFETGDRQCRQIVSLLAQGVQRVFVYSMHAQNYIGGKTQWRTIVTEEGQLHPSGCAYSAMAWLLEDTRFAKRLQLAEGIYAYLFAGGGRSVAVLSSAPKYGDFTIPRPAGVTVADLFGNPLPEGSKFAGRLVYLSTDQDIAALERALTAR